MNCPDCGKELRETDEWDGEWRHYYICPDVECGYCEDENGEVI